VTEILVSKNMFVTG